MYNAPKNEEIIALVCEAEKYLKVLIGKLVELNATPNTLRSIVEALSVINHSYMEHSVYHVQSGCAMPSEGLQEKILASLDELIKKQMQQEQDATK